MTAPRNTLNLLDGSDMAGGASPQVGSLAACPRCFEVVNRQATVCRSCQFEIFKYSENLSQSKVLRMARTSGDHHRVWLRKHYRQGSDWLWIGFVIVGILLAFVPVVNIIAAPAMFLCALITLVAPARGSMLLDFLFEHRSYKEKVAVARRTAENTYTDVFCPCCGHCFASAKKGTIYGWSDARQYSLKCPNCGGVSQRVSDTLMWVPHPSVTRTGNLAEYITAQ